MTGKVRNRVVHPVLQHAIDQLNTEQRAVVLAPLQDNLAVLAGAGTGKTSVLTLRIAWLLHNGAAPESILALTFTRSAALEMRERLGKLVGPAAQKVRLTTFHSTGFQLLRKYGERLGLSNSWQCMDEDDGEAIVRRYLKTNPRWDKSSMKPADRLLEVLVYKDRLHTRRRRNFQPGTPPVVVAPNGYQALPPDEATVLPFSVAETYRAYEREKSQSHLLDYTDLSVLPLRLLQEYPDCLADVQASLQYLLVDEFQDTDSEQMELIRELTGDWKTATLVVGDDDQSLYSWRGAVPGIFQQFIQESRAQVHKLEENYRCQPFILECANTVIRNNQERMGKDLRPNRGTPEHLEIRKFQNDKMEAQGLRDQIRIWLGEGAEPRDIALLYRKSRFSAELERALLQANIPYKVFGGTEFFKREEIKDTLAYLRLVLNPKDDQAFLRIANKPRRGIGDKALSMHQALAEDWEVSYLEACAGSKHKGFQELGRLMQQLSDIQGLPPSQALDRILTESGLMQWYATEQSNKEKGERQAERLELLLDNARTFEDQATENGVLPTLDAYLMNASLETEATATSGNAVSLMTIHKAKGLEFPFVVVVALEEGEFPSARSTNEEEERRLFYVALTRGKDRVLLTYAENRMSFGTYNRSWPSPFLRELPRQRVTGDLFARAKERVLELL